MTVRLDGLGAGAGTATLAATLKDPGGATVATSDAVVVASGDAEAWVDLPFAGGPLLGSDGVWAAHVAATAGDSTVVRWLKVTSPYDGGTDNVASFASLFPDFAPPAGSSLFDVARLPLAEAQKGLASSGRVGPPILTTLGWHGQRADIRIGSYALASPTGPLAGTAGKVLRITPRDGSGAAAVYAYVLSDQADLEADPLTVTRRLFQQLAVASEYDFPVLVEVVP